MPSSDVLKQLFAAYKMKLKHLINNLKNDLEYLYAHY